MWSCVRGPAGSGVVDDDESGRGRLLGCLAQTGLLRWSSKDSARAEVVDPSLEEAGLQAQTADLPRLQLQLVAALTHPGEGAGHVCRLWAGTHRRNAQQEVRMWTSPP